MLEVSKLGEFHQGLNDRSLNPGGVRRGMVLGNGVASPFHAVRSGERCKLSHWIPRKIDLEVFWSSENASGDSGSCHWGFIRPPNAQHTSQLWPQKYVEKFWACHSKRLTFKHYLKDIRHSPGDATVWLCLRRAGTGSNLNAYLYLVRMTVFQAESLLNQLQRQLQAVLTGWYVSSLIR